MPRQHDVQADAGAVRDLPAEIGGSLASVWARYAGSRPSGAVVEFDGSVVRWTLSGGTDAVEEGITADAGAEPPPESPRTMLRYRRELASVVSRATHRKVVAAISKQDAKTGIATETFILEVLPKKY